MWHPVVMNYDLLYDIYTLGKRGVTIGIKAGWSARPSSWVVCVVFSYDCSLCNEQRMAGRNDAAISAALQAMAQALGQQPNAGGNCDALFLIKQ